MHAAKSQKTPVLTSEQANQIYAATGLSGTRIRHLLKTGTRPRNPITAAAWDEVLTELGIGSAK